MHTSPESFGLKSSGNKNKIKLFITLGTLLVGVALLSLAFGGTRLDIGEAVWALSMGDFANADFRILFYIRLPRLIAALLAGSALAVSGVLIQAVLNNPMAAPNVIGVNSGAGLAAAVTVALAPNALTVLPMAAFVGALLTCLFIFAIAQRTNASKLTITLVGIAVGSVLNAGINTVKVLFPDSVYDADLFMIGGFSGVTYEKVMPAGIVIILALGVAGMLARDIDILSLGDNTAQSLGMNIKLIRHVLLIIASALAGAAVSFAGLLGFVGLLVPHIMRKMVGTRHRVLIPASAFAGSIFVISCDLFSRVAFAPFEIPVGILLSLVGGAFFIFLVLFMKRGGGI